MSENDDIKERVRKYYVEYWLTHAKIKTGEAMNVSNSLLLGPIRAKVDDMTCRLDRETAAELLKTIREELRTTSATNLGLTTKDKHKLNNLLSQFP